MADDITLTVRVRDLSRGDFNRLDQRLDRMRRDLQGVSRDTDSAGMHSRRLGNDINGLQQKFQRMQQTGTLTRRELTQMRGALDGMSRSALNAARSGEITHDRFSSLNGEIGRMRAELARFDAGLNNNTNTINRNNNQHRTTVRLVNGVVQSIRTATRSMGSNTNVINTWRRDAGRVAGTVNRLGDSGSVAGKAFGNMHAKLIGVAAVLIASLLPTIGALAPMLAGLGAMVGVAALAFSGLSAPTKFLSKDQKEFLKALKPVTNEFKQLRKSAQAAVLPTLTKSFGDVSKAVKSLNPVITVAGDAFGKLVGKIAKGVSSKDFMGPFLKNVKMGTKWVLDFAGSIGTFTKAFFDFGTKSQKALDAWQNLLGGFLDRGLPSMFKNMESGISGSSDFLNGLAYVINDSLLPSLGKMLGAFMKTFGPFLEQLLIGAGNVFNNFANIFDGAMTGISPVMSLVTDTFRAFNDAARIGSEVFGDLASVLGGAVLGTLVDLGVIKDPFGDLTKGFTGFSDWVKKNESAIRGAFTLLGLSIITMVQVGVGALPVLMNGFTLMATVVLEAVGTIINGMATAFGKIPGIGKIFTAAAAGFNELKSGWEENLDSMSTKVGEFAGAAQSNLSKAKLTLNVSEAKRNLDDIKAQLKDPNLTKERRATLQVQKDEAERKLAQATAALRAFAMKKYAAKVDANNAPFFGKLSAANRARLNSKSASIKANPASFWSSVRSLSGRVLGTSYINVQMRKVESQNAPAFSANGNVFRKSFANGGVEDHRAQIADGTTTRVWNEPETGGESYIPLGAAKRTRSRQIAETTVGILGGNVEWYAKGGLSKKQKAAKAKAKAQAQAESQARSGAVGELTISHFGKMAGYKNDEFKHELGLPDALSGLVDSLNKWRSVILKSTHGGLEKSLLKQLDKAGKSLIKYDKQLTTVNKSLESAKTKLSDLKSAAASLKESVTSGVMSSTNITKVATGDDKNVTMTDIMAQMRQSVDKSSAFSGALTGLQKKGVSSTIIQQIAEAGIEGGGMQTAGALLSASSSEIKTLNDMQKKINDYAKKSGTTAADAMYGAGIKAAQGLVDGLTKKKKAIETAMMNIAKAMEKSIKKALKIKSPSKVMEQVGHYTAEGFAVGVKKNRKVDTAWTSMLNVPSGGGTSGGAASGEQYVIPIYIGGKFFDEVWLDAGRRVVRTRGGVVQNVLSPGRKAS